MSAVYPLSAYLAIGVGHGFALHVARCRRLGFLSRFYGFCKKMSAIKSKIIVSIFVSVASFPLFRHPVSPNFTKSSPPNERN